MTTENVERIEIVRGPFSALYGSDAIGGVVQIFTRPGVAGLLGPGDAARRGNQGQGRGLGVRVGRRGPLLGDGELSLRRLRRRRAPTPTGAQRNGSARLRRGSRDASRIGVRGLDPGRRGRKSRAGRRARIRTARGFFHEERFAVPGHFALSRHEPSRRRCWRERACRSRRTDDPLGGFASQTDAADAPGARRRHGAARRPHADGIRLVGALEGGRREQLRRQPRRPDDDALGARRPGLRDLRRVHGHGGPSLRPPLDLRRRTGARAATVSWLSADRLWKVRASGGTRIPRADDRRALLPVLRESGPEARALRVLGGRRRALRRRAGASRSRSSGTT